MKIYLGKTLEKTIDNNKTFILFYLWLHFFHYRISYFFSITGLATPGNNFLEEVPPAQITRLKILAAHDFKSEVSLLDYRIKINVNEVLKFCRDIQMSNDNKVLQVNLDEQIFPYQRTESISRVFVEFSIKAVYLAMAGKIFQFKLHF